VSRGSTERHLALFDVVRNSLSISGRLASSLSRTGPFIKTRKRVTPLKKNTFPITLAAGRDITV
jgi:hypothetical protein